MMNQAPRSAAGYYRACRSAFYSCCLEKKGLLLRASKPAPSSMTRPVRWQACSRPRSTCTPAPAWHAGWTGQQQATPASPRSTSLYTPSRLPTIGGAARRCSRHSTCRNSRYCTNRTPPKEYLCTKVCLGRHVGIGSALAPLIYCGARGALFRPYAVNLALPTMECSEQPCLRGNAVC